ncbi:sensor histidine kinase [Actinoplanes sp. NPDC020271]|uniref:sensor histidine kinase n=1 Tax=Actinoplanes sp. NPDC020271 TaxID=3363896 RepID=UPI00378C78F5
MTNWQTAGPADWERRLQPMVTVVPYLLLGGLTLFTVIVEHGHGIALDLGLGAVAAGWNLVFFTVRPAWRDRPRIMEVFLGGLILLGLALAARHPWFGFYTPALYFYAYRIIGWPRELFYVAGAGLVAGTAQATGSDYGTWAGRLTWLTVVAANVVPMCLLAWLIQIAARYHQARDRAMHETQEANSRLATALAENAALQGELVEQARLAGVQDERSRMAREIHDTIAQGLTGIVTQLQAAGHAAADPAAWRRHHEAATALARESLTEARRSVNELRPEPLDGGRLADAVTDVAARWSARQGIPAQVTVTGDRRVMRPAAEVALLRTAQEALANVAKHAPDAGRVGLTLSYMDAQVALDVRDDGPGFDPAAHTAGFGLVAMRQRIEALSGTLQIESESGGGTGISACLPADPPEARP